MPKLNRYNDGGFVYGQWREVGRRVDPVTGDIIITERRDGSKDVRYNERGVSWRKGYEDWLAAGNEGTMEDFKLEAEAWKRAQDRKEFDSQSRERRIKRNQEGEGGDDGEKPSDDPRPDGFVGDGPGGGGPDGGGGSGDVSRPGKDDNVNRPRKPGDVNIPDVSIRPKPILEIPTAESEPMLVVPYSESDVRRMLETGVLPPPRISQSPEQMGEVTIEDDNPYQPGDVNVQVESSLEYDQRPNLFGRDVVREKFDYDSTNTYDDEVIHQNIRQRSKQKDGGEKRTRGRQLFEVYDSEGNRTFKEKVRLKKGGLVPKNNNDMQEIRSYRKGGKTFPDLTGDGKVTRADILAGRGVIKKKKKKKSMAYGGKVKLMRKGGEVEYGLGGMIFKGANALAQGKGIGAALKAGAKGLVTPGSGVSGAVGLAGTLAQKSNNPMLQNIGKVAGAASNFLPGGGGVAGLAGNFMQNMGGGSGMASVAQPLQGLFKQRHGGYVSPKHRLF